MRKRFQYHADMTIRPLIALWAFFAALLLAPRAAFPIDDAPAAGHPVVLVTEQMKPFSYTEDGAARGIAVDIVTEALEAAGIAYTLEFLPWHRAMERVEGEPGAFIFCIARTPERERRFAWVAPLAPAEVGLFRLHSRTDLAGVGSGNLATYRMAAIRGYFTSEILRQWGVPEGNVTLFPDLNKRKVIEHLELGWSDFFLGDPLVFSIELKAAGKEHELVLNGPALRVGDYYLAAHPATDPALLRRVGEALRRLRESGRAKAILQEYSRRERP
ncbi:substrate-binding periplasmic protein [Desulfovibrio sp.]